MQNYRFFFLVMVYGMYCMHNICAMELVQYNANNDVIIDVHRFWSDDYNYNINNIKSVDLKEMRSSFKDELFLSVSDDTLQHLLYLSTVRKDDNKTLFTQKQQNKFDAALQIKRSVPWVFGVNGVIIVATSLFPLSNLAALSQCVNAAQFDCLSQLAAIMTPTAMSISGAFAVGFISLYATGLSPDISSRRANKVQDEIDYLRRSYATIAKYWIDIYFKCPEKALYIAGKIDIEELKKRAQLKTYKKKGGSSVVAPLEEAWHFITHKTVLITFTEIENYLYNKIYRQDIDCFEERIKSLEQVVQQQNAEIKKLKQEAL